MKSVITGKRTDGDFDNASLTNGNNLKISLEEFENTFYEEPLPVANFYLNVSKGLVPGHSVINKFGQNDAIGTGAYEDI